MAESRSEHVQQVAASERGRRPRRDWHAKLTGLSPGGGGNVDWDTETHLYELILRSEEY